MIFDTEYRRQKVQMDGLAESEQAAKRRNEEDYLKFLGNETRIFWRIHPRSLNAEAVLHMQRFLVVLKARSASFTSRGSSSSSRPWCGYLKERVTRPKIRMITVASEIAKSRPRFLTLALTNSLTELSQAHTGV
jgi:hypothetical protein